MSNVPAAQYEPVAVDATVVGLPQPCRMTRPEFVQALERSGYGERDVVYRTFFHRADNGSALCNSCGLPIGYHANTDPAVVPVPAASRSSRGEGKIPFPPETAAGLHNKAFTLLAIGGSANFREAVTLLDRAVAIQTAALGADHPETALSMHSKAFALVQLGGSANLRAAVPLYDRAIEIWTAALGADHPHTTTALQNKAQAIALLHKRSADSQRCTIA
jgi:hypothetical protein